jgi:flavin reductase (DIM6/NTAB) family NADH-FMN oxidoreductase RutF
VSFPKPDQVVLTSLAASPRCGDHLTEKPILQGLPTVKSKNIDALFLKDSHVYLECSLFKVIQGFGSFGLIAGKITSAWVDEDSKVWSGSDPASLINSNPLLAYIATGRFASIKETHEFPFPKGFEKGTS